MSQSLIFLGEDANRIIKAGLISTSACVFTARDKVEIKVYRGYKAVMGLKVKISREQDEEKLDK